MDRMQSDLTLPRLHCLRCQHQWVPRGGRVRICPHCKSHLWDKPKGISETKPTQKTVLETPGQRAVHQYRKSILRLATEHGARNIRIFGSVARGTDSEGSDLDFLVDMPPDHSLLDRAGLMVELRELLGRPVDVVTERSLYAPIRSKVLMEAVPL